MLGQHGVADRWLQRQTIVAPVHFLLNGLCGQGLVDVGAIDPHIGLLRVHMAQALVRVDAQHSTARQAGAEVRRSNADLNSITMW